MHSELLHLNVCRHRKLFRYFDIQQTIFWYSTNISIDNQNYRLKECLNDNPKDNQNMWRSSSLSSASWLTNRGLVWLMWPSQVDNYGDDYVIMMMVVVIVVTSSRLSGWTLGLSEICLRGWIPKQSIYVDITALPSFFAFFKSTQSYSDRYDCYESLSGELYIFCQSKA